MTGPRDTPGTSEAEEEPLRCPCGRLLTDPVSRARGLGPVCFRRLRGRTRPRRRTVGTHISAPHPRAIPVRRPTQLAFEIWDDTEAELDPFRPRAIFDVPTGALL